MTPTSLERRFWSKIIKGKTKKDCWVWTDAIAKDGYARLKNKGRSISAYRLSWEIAYGQIPNGLQVHRNCLTKGCVNPLHLRLGQRRDLLIRFWEKVRKTDQCWIWEGAISTGGYGQIKRSGHNVHAHRIAWELTYGKIPKGLYVCHHCDNRRCVHPEHLFLGTAKDNSLDMVMKNRHHVVIGELNPNAKLKNTQVKEIKRGLQSGKTDRELATLFGVKPYVIYFIRKGIRWQHVQLI